jgi:LysM repeat protein
MNTPNPLNPQGSFLEQKDKGRARVKIAVIFVLSIHAVGLLALLMQGCKPEPEMPAPESMTNTASAFVEPTNPAATSNNAAVTPPVAPPVIEPFQPVVSPTPPTTIGATEYKVAKGDSFSTIAPKFHVTVKALAAANPGVDSSKLKIDQTLHIPAPTASTVAPTPSGATAPTVPSANGEQIYTVKSGDTLTKIASQFGTTAKAIRALNGLTTDRITVKQKLKIPAKAAAAAPAAPATAPVETAPPSAPATTPAPPPGQ